MTNQGIDYCDIRYVTKDFSEKNKKSKLSKHDILIARHGDNGKTCIFEDDIEAQALNVVIVVPKNDNTYTYINEMLNSNEVQKQIKYAVGGSVQGVVNTQTIANSKVAYSEKIVKMYSEKILPVYNKMEKLRKENRQLVSLRDWLLPMLMNGQVGFEGVE